jgi:hypothetical protein
MAGPLAAAAPDAAPSAWTPWAKDDAAGPFYVAALPQSAATDDASPFSSRLGLLSSRRLVIESKPAGGLCQRFDLFRSTVGAVQDTSCELLKRYSIAVYAD